MNIFIGKYNNSDIIMKQCEWGREKNLQY
jgi:hypothetical protein